MDNTYQRRQTTPTRIPIPKMQQDHGHQRIYAVGNTLQQVDNNSTVEAPVGSAAAPVPSPARRTELSPRINTQCEFAVRATSWPHLEPPRRPAINFHHHFPPAQPTVNVLLLGQRPTIKIAVPAEYAEYDEFRRILFPREPAYWAGRFSGLSARVWQLNPPQLMDVCEAWCWQTLWDYAITREARRSLSGALLDLRASEIYSRGRKLKKQWRPAETSDSETGEEKSTNKDAARAELQEISRNGVPVQPRASTYSTKREIDGINKEKKRKRWGPGKWKGKK